MVARNFHTSLETVKGWPYVQVQFWASFVAPIRAHESLSFINDSLSANAFGGESDERTEYLNSLKELQGEVFLKSAKQRAGREE